MKKIYTLLASITLFSCSGGPSQKSASETPDPAYLYPMERVDDAVAIVNIRTGEELPGYFASADLFYDGLSRVRDRHSLRYGYLNPDGTYAIEPQYASATIFSDGIAFVALPDSGLMAINPKGKVLFTLPNVEQVGPYEKGVALGALTSGESCIIDGKGNITSLPQGVEFTWSTAMESDLISVEDQDGKHGMVNPQGQFIIPCQYESLALALTANDLICYFAEDRFGFLSKSGETVIQPSFDEVHPLPDGNLLIEIDNQWGLADPKGKITINPQFEGMMPDGDLFLIQKNDLLGWCDKKGNIIINPQFEAVSLFGDANLTPARSGREFGYIDKSGKFAINPQFSEAGSFSEGLAPVKKPDDELMGYIDEKGHMQIEPQFDRASSFGDGLAMVTKDDEIGFIDKQGLYVINPQFSDVILPKELHSFKHIGEAAYNYYRKSPYIPCGGASFFAEGNLLPVETKDHKTVLIDRTGRYASNLYSKICMDAEDWHTSGAVHRYMTAKSDKVDIQPIVELLVSNIRDIDIQATAQQLKQHYGVQNDRFKNGTVELKNQEITCADLSIKASCNPWSRVSDGWFGYKRVFNESSIPEYYDVVLHLTGKAADKEESFLEKFRKAFGEQLNLSSDGTYQLDGKHIELLSEYENEFYFRITKLE